MLIGSNIPEAHWNIYQQIRRRGEAFATLSILGCVLKGPFRGKVGMNFQVNCLMETHSIENMLNRMYNWEFEELRCTHLVSQDDVKVICKWPLYPSTSLGSEP